MVRTSLALYDSKCWNACSQGLSNIARDPGGVCGFQTYRSASLSKLTWPPGLFLLWLQNVISSPSIHWQKKCCFCHFAYIHLPRAPPLTQTLICFSSRLLDRSSITCRWLTTHLVRERKCVSQGFCCWDKHHDQKQLKEVKGLFHLPVCIPSPRKVRVETQGSAHAMEECCLRPCSPWLAQPVLLDTSGSHGQRWCHHNGLCLQINHLLRKCPTGSCAGHCFSTAVPFSRGTLVCVKLTINYPR